MVNVLKYVQELEKVGRYRMTIKFGTMLTLAIGVTAMLVRLIPGAR
jgi:hypothetical protein